MHGMCHSMSVGRDGEVRGGNAHSSVMLKNIIVEWVNVKYIIMSKSNEVGWTDKDSWFNWIISNIFSALISIMVNHIYESGLYVFLFLLPIIYAISRYAVKKPRKNNRQIGLVSIAISFIIFSLSILFWYPSVVYDDHGMNRYFKAMSVLFYNKPSPGITIYLNSAMQELYAMEIKDNLSHGLYGEVVIDNERPNSMVPNDIEVRYFNDSDIMRAGRISDNLRYAGYMSVVSKKSDAYPENKERIEIWFPKDIVRTAK